MKYRIYIDEVGNNDLGSSTNPNHRFLCLTGVIFELDYVKNVLTPDIEALKNKYFESHPDEPVIFHRKEMVNKKHPFKALGNPEIENEFNTEFLFLLEKWEFKSITVLMDKLEHQNKYSEWRYDPYHYCMAIINWMVTDLRNYHEAKKNPVTGVSKGISTFHLRKYELIQK